MANKTIHGLPVFEAELTSENCRVLRVSLVDRPAVEVDFVAYDKQTPVATYAVTDEDKQRVMGCVLRADYPIYRRDEDGTEYFIEFKAEQIRAYAQKYLAEGRANNVDLDHDFVEIEGAEMVQYFLKDTAKGIAPAGFDDVAEGSLFAEYQITDSDLWERIKSGEFKGFSVEIIHSLIPAEYKQHNTSNMKKTLIERMKSALAKAVAEIENEESAESYKTIATDKGSLIYDEDELAVGVAVHGEDEDGNRVELADGEYNTDDERVIVIENGKVSEIKDAQQMSAVEGEQTEGEQNAEQGEAVQKQEMSALDKFRAKVSAYSLSYDEKMQKIYEAFRALFADVYVYEAGDDFAIVEAYNGNGYGYYRYALTMGEDGEVSIDTASAMEVEFKFVPKGMQIFSAEQMREKDEQIADLEAKLNEPAGKSAHDTYKEQKQTLLADNPFEACKKYIRK